MQGLKGFAGNGIAMHRVLDAANNQCRKRNFARSVGRAGVAMLAVICAFFARPVFAGGTGLVALSEIDPSIRQDMRYATARNFTGDRVRGYEAGECWLRPSVAHALANVQRDLLANESGLTLKVFDCYRPRRSVRAFVDWAGRAEDGRTRNYYPNLSRPELLSLGYIGRNSSHSKGIAVDLTLVRTSPKDVASSRDDAKTACTGTSDEAFDPASLDMGTTFDCFDPKSHTARSGLSSEQRNARQTLKRYMERHGFSNYRKEWWHYTYGAADDGRSFDVPVKSADHVPVPSRGTKSPQEADAIKPTKKTKRPSQETGQTQNTESKSPAVPVE